MASGIITDDEMAKMEAAEAKYPGFLSDEDMAKMETSAKVSPLESGVRGAADMATLGFADEGTGAAQALLEKVKGNPSKLSELYEKYRNESRKNYETAEKANPKSYMAGQVVGGVGASFIPGLNAGAGAGLARTAGKMALQGGITGLGKSEADPLSMQTAKDVALGTAGGAAGGAVGYGAGKAVGAGANAVKEALPKMGEKARKLAEYLSARALGAERGTIKKLGEQKVLGAGGQALDEGVVRPFSSSEGMLARNTDVKSRAGKGMEEVYKAIDEKGASTFNPLDTAVKVEKEVGPFWRSPINAGETRQFENTLNSVLMRGDKNIPLAEAQLLKEEIAKTANWRNTLNPTDKEKMARDAYKAISESIDTATEQGAKDIGSEGLLNKLTQSKKLYSGAKTADELLQNKIARDQGNKMIGLTDTVAGAGGVATGNPMTALKLIAGKKIAERFGPQTAAVGANAVSKILKSAPQVLGKYAPILQEAAQRGTSQLMLTHQLLMKTKPDYVDTINQISGQQEGDEQ